MRQGTISYLVTYNDVHRSEIAHRDVSVFRKHAQYTVELSAQADFQEDILSRFTISVA